MTLDDLNALPSSDFLAAFGPVAEHTPWVAERAIAYRPYATREAMVDAFQLVIARAARGEQEALVAAHPDLAGKAALAGAMAEDSRIEQAGAGLDSLTPDEFERFQAVNRRYLARFGFPFIFAVKGATKERILDAFEQRIDGGREEEFLTALSQVMRIVRFRLEGKVAG